MERREENAFAGAHADAEARDSSRPPATLLSGPDRTQPAGPRTFSLPSSKLPRASRIRGRRMSVHVISRIRPCLVFLLRRLAGAITAAGAAIGRDEGRAERDRGDDDPKQIPRSVVSG